MAAADHDPRLAPYPPLSGWRRTHRSAAGAALTAQRLAPHSPLSGWRRTRRSAAGAALTAQQTTGPDELADRAVAIWLVGDRS